MPSGRGNDSPPSAAAAAAAATTPPGGAMQVLGTSSSDTPSVTPSLGCYHPECDVPQEKAGFVVWSSSCQIPDVDAYDKSIRRFLKPVNPVVCSKNPPLTYVAVQGEDGEGSGEDAEGGEVGRGHVLHIDAGVVPLYSTHLQRLKCCYSNVTRFTTPPGVNYTKQADNYYNISSCKSFEKEVKLEPQEEFILVQCDSYPKNDKSKATPKKKVYVNMHGIVPIKPSVAKKRRTRKTPDDDSWLNVLMVGIDSMSRLNLLRTMPKTVAYLKRAGFLDLQGYNKIGDNTFPNIMAILTGMNMDQLRMSCWDSKKSKVDDCPFVWKDFHNHSYVSAYAEDEPTISTFNYEKTGFVIQPTDYYFRPYMLAASKKLQIQRRNGLDICMGPVSTTDHILRYALDFVTTFKNSLYFALFWMNNFSHNDINDPGAMDLRFHQFLNELGGTGTYNNTIVIFFSDHGMRFGNIRKTYVGWLEERLPFIYILLPDWFQTKHPDVYKNLLANRNRLTTPFDLHATLRDVLDRGMNISSATGNVSLACPKCKSLLVEKFGDRSCDDAGITPHWCTCTQYKELQVNDSTVQNAAKFVLTEIQKKVSSSTQAEICAELIMHQVIKASKKVHVKEQQPDHDDYVIIFETLPGGGLFESTVRRALDSEEFSILGMVSRINSYARDSFCVNDSELKLYCFCLPTR